jgi:hypothetical protein
MLEKRKKDVEMKMARLLNLYHTTCEVHSTSRYDTGLKTFGSNMAASQSLGI